MNSLPTGDFPRREEPVNVPKRIDLNIGKKLTVVEGADIADLFLSESEAAR